MDGIGAMEQQGGRPAEAEGRLIEEAKAGQPEAWAEIYERHYRPLFRYALARVGDQPLAEDLTATVFLEALKGIHSYSYQGRPLLAWLYRIARNVVADHRRRALGRTGTAKGLQSRVLLRSTRSHHDGAADADISLPDSGAEERNAERLDLKRALDRLGGPQREVIALHYFAGFSLREVARLLGKNERAVYSLQARALAALRRHLSE